MRSRALLVVVAVCMIGGCGHRRVFDVSGTWTGGLQQEHSAFEVLMLRQDGLAISGVICRLSSGHRVFYDVPVSGRYPTFTFPLFGDTVTAHATSEDLIVGSQSTPGSAELFFTRTSSSDYAECAAASP